MARFSNPGTEIAELSSVIDALHSLFEAAENKKEIGFNGIRHKWEKTAFEGLFLYSDTGVFAAINVPGNGRAQTFDLTLAGMAFAKNNTGDIRKDVDAFLTQVNERRRKDNEHDWE